MESNEEALARIIGEMTHGMWNSQKVRAIASKLAQGTATYADAEAYARESGRILTGSMKNHIPETLTDGYLYRETAEVVVREPMTRCAADVAETAKQIQESLNESADIGISAIVPEVNQDQITGIITGICNRPYEEGQKQFYQQVGNFLEGYVDDFVHDNAEFQYQAGLEPTIERIADGKCCPWCDRLAGTYPYADVSDRGNDVFRRHNNCHCQVLFNPADGSKKRQDVHSKRWTSETEAAKMSSARIASLQSDKDIQLASSDVTNLRDELVAKSVGAKSLNYDIMDLQTGEMFHLAEGEYLHDKKVFAGKGSKTEYREAYKYAERFGGKAEDWQHVKAIGTVDYYGEKREAEIHWSQHDDYGKHDLFIKEWRD